MSLTDSLEALQSTTIRHFLQSTDQQSCLLQTISHPLQMVVEKQLAGEGLSRREMGRDRFEGRVWQWQKQFGGSILQQLRRLGASCDWSRERFTLDPDMSGMPACPSCLQIYTRLTQQYKSAKQEMLQEVHTLLKPAPTCLQGL